MSTRLQVVVDDAIHIATMERHGCTRIMSFDAGFDGFPGLTRLA